MLVKLLDEQFLVLFEESVTLEFGFVVREGLEEVQPEAEDLVALGLRAGEAWVGDAAVFLDAMFLGVRGSGEVGVAEGAAEDGGRRVETRLDKMQKQPLLLKLLVLPSHCLRSANSTLHPVRH